MSDASYHEQLIAAFLEDLRNGCDVAKIEEAIADGEFRSQTVAAFREAQRRLEEETPA